MSARVAVVPIQNDYDQAVRHALELIGGIDGLNSPERDVTIKVGIFDPRQHHHTCPETLAAIIAAFDQAPRVLLAESDSYCGKSLERLQRFKELFSQRVQPHSLSDDPETRTLETVGEAIPFSHVLFKPNVFISTHVMRTFTKGSILKNLFGCTPIVKKSRYHKEEVYCQLIADLVEAIGGIDLAVLDGTFLHHGASGKKSPMNLLVVGRDALAVEVVGMTLAGAKPQKMPIIQEFVRRGLGEGDINQIEILGVSADEFAQLKRKHRELKQVLAAARDAEPSTPGAANIIKELIQEGWLDQWRTAQEVINEVQARGGKKATRAQAEGTLKRRLGKTIEQAQDGKERRYRRIASNVIADNDGKDLD